MPIFFLFLERDPKGDIFICWITLPASLKIWEGECFGDALDMKCLSEANSCITDKTIPCFVF